MTNRVIVTRELVDKCFGFVVGEKNGKYPRFYDIKNAEFPDNLLRGTEQQREVMGLLESGKTTRQAGAELGVSAMMVSSRRKTFLAGLEFREEWLAFWEFIEPVRKLLLSDVLIEWKDPKERTAAEKMIIGRFLGNCKRKEIETVGDLLHLYSNNNQRDAKAVVRMSHKDFIFGIIRDKVYTLLTVSN
jgi:hypothetical protein